MWQQALYHAGHIWQAIPPGKSEPSQQAQTKSTLNDTSEENAITEENANTSSQPASQPAHWAQADNKLN